MSHAANNDSDKDDETRRMLKRAADELAHEFKGTFHSETIQQFLRISAAALSPIASVNTVSRARS